jgi:hypothetical protein
MQSVSTAAIAGYYVMVPTLFLFAKQTNPNQSNRRSTVQ